MRAVCWNGPNDIRVENVPDPKILNPQDVIVRITSTAICGSDLHLLDGYVPSMMPGDIMGHEFMGEVVDVGKDVVRLKNGDRVVVPFTIACGHCFFCEHDMWSLCDNSNPNAEVADKLFGHSASGLFGYSHIFGGYAGGQAEYVRVPFADVGPLKVPTDLTDEQVLFLSDILPTAYQAAENCNISPGDTIAMWGCGPVGQLTIKCAYLLGAERVIAIDHEPDRLEMARKHGAETIDFREGDVLGKLYEMTAGRGPDACIDAVGMEAHGLGVDAVLDQVSQAVRLQTDRPTALRYAIQACRKGGTVSIPGVYGGIIDKMPIGAAFNKGLTLKMGQTHVHKDLPTLLRYIQNGDVDATSIITHRVPLGQAPEAYDAFKYKKDNCVKVVMKP